MKAQPTEREIHKDELYAQHLENQEQAMKELVDEKRAEQLQRFQTHQELIAQPSVPRYNPLYTLGKHAGKPGFTRDQMNMASEKGLRLVPIRLDVDHEGVKIRDTFTWNLYETVISPELFARRLCKDVGFYQPTKELLNQIIGSLTEQIADYNQYAPEQLDQRETLNRGNDGIDSGEHDHAELRTIIKLDITIDQQCVVDQFEWDIGCSRNSPEIFAELLVSELKLVPEFKTAIAHSIREQIQSVSKSLLIGNHDFTSSKIRDEELSSLFLQPVLPGLSRRYGESWDKFGPVISQASVLEMEKMEKDLERESRRKRRQTQRSKRGITLPDRDTTNKATRTLLPIPIKFEPTVPTTPVVQAPDSPYQD